MKSRLLLVALSAFLALSLIACNTSTPEKENSTSSLSPSGSNATNEPTKPANVNDTRSIPDPSISQKTLVPDNTFYPVDPVIFSTTAEENGLGDTPFYITGEVTSRFDMAGYDTIQFSASYGEVYISSVLVPLDIDEGDTATVYFLYTGLSDDYSCPCGVYIYHEPESTPDETPLMSLDDLCSLVENTIGDSYSGFTVTHDENMITITCWADGIASELAGGGEAIKSSWGDLIENSKAILNNVSDLAKKSGHEGVGACYRLLNDLDHDKTLLYIVDNVVEYNVLDDQSDPAPEHTPAPTESTTMGQRNALSKANQYLSIMAFSHSGLINQLEFEGYTTEEATYGADNCGADWNEQAAKKAQQYIDLMSFSRQGLIDQLKFDGFTQSQAEYGVSAVGY